LIWRSGRLDWRPACSDDQLDQVPERHVCHQQEDRGDEDEQKGGLGRLDDFLASRPRDATELGAGVAEVLKEALEHMPFRPLPLCEPCACVPTGSTCASRASSECCAGSCASRSCGVCTRCTREAALSVHHWP